MPYASINDVKLYYEIQGSGPPLVLVHGSWDSHAVWDQVAERLADRFSVISYDRRSHSRSERPSGPQTRRQQEDDLAALITELAGGPAYVAANSFGGVISMGLAARRPELIRALTVHEPPAIGAADGGDLAERAQAALSAVDTVLSEIEAGADERATRRFVEEVAIGPGGWDLCPDAMRIALVENAPAFVAEQRDPDVFALDFTAVRLSGCPMLLTKGDESPVWLQQLLDRLGELLPLAAKTTIEGAGHVPHETNPAEYADVIDAFFRQPAAVAA